MSLLRYRNRRQSFSATGGRLPPSGTTHDTWVIKVARELVDAGLAGIADAEWETRLRRALEISPAGVLPSLYVLRSSGVVAVHSGATVCMPVGFSPEAVVANLLAEDSFSAIPLDQCCGSVASSREAPAPGRLSNWVQPVRGNGRLLGFWIGNVGPNCDPHVLAQIEEINYWIAVSREIAVRTRSGTGTVPSRTPPLARWLAADSLISLCSLVWSDFREIHGLSHLLIVAHGGGGPLGWALTPRDERARLVDDWFAARVNEQSAPRGKKTPVCPVGSARLPLISPVLQQAGFRAGASVDTGRSTSYCVFWSRDGIESPARRQIPAVEEDDLILKGPLWGQLQLALTNMARIEYLRELSHIDSITRVFNRRYFNLRLTEETSRARRSGRPLSLLVFDIDHFKELNDSMGHQAGDAILRRLAEYVRWTVRSTDLLCRLSGDEFCILMPDTDSEECLRLGERLHTSLREKRFMPDSGLDSVTVGISIGGAVFPRHAHDAEEVLWCADMALLSAKQRGRNCFLLYDPSMSSNGCAK